MADNRKARTRRTPILWIAFMLLCGVGSLAFVNLSRSAADIFQPGPSSGAWTGNQRVNILLLGIDERESWQGPWRTDTLMLLSLDPGQRRAALLSIPRDLWVTLPGLNQQGKINTAHFLGDAHGYPGGGPALAMATLEATLGVRVGYYLRLNFSGFERLIDLIGGIDVDVPYPIDDPLYPDSGYGYEPLSIPAGRVHLDGPLALKYARTRHDLMGDFDRMVRQQQVLRAVRDKVLQANLLPALIGQAPALLQTLGESVKTNLSVEQLMQLARLAQDIPLAQIDTFTIGPEMITALRVESNPPQDALLLKPEALLQVRDRLQFTLVTPSPVSPAASAQPIGLPTLAATSPLTPTGQTRTYLVQPGDTLYAIAAQFDTTLEDLMAANGLTSYDIFAGQELIIP